MTDRTDLPENFLGIDLHRHLDGSVSDETAELMYDVWKYTGVDIFKWEIGEQGLFPKEVLSPSKISKTEFKQTYMTVKPGCNNVLEFLRDGFMTTYPLTKFPRVMEELAYYDCKRCKEQNILYFETRFAPILQVGGGFDNQEQVIKTVAKGLKRGMKDFNVKANIILCLYRGPDSKGQPVDPVTSIETVKLAYVLRDRGIPICGIDIAGAETFISAERHKPAFELAKNPAQAEELLIADKLISKLENKKPFGITMHAGEVRSLVYGTNNPWDNVLQAIEFGADRIGHGIQIINNEEVIEQVKKHNVTLEVCYQSNYDTGAVLSDETHPIRKLFDKGVKIAPCTDDPSVSNIDLRDEYQSLLDIGFSMQELKQMVSDSISAAFVDEETKQNLNQTI